MSTTEMVRISGTCSNLAVLHTIASYRHVPKGKQPCLAVLNEHCFSLCLCVIAEINPKVTIAGTYF